MQGVTVAVIIKTAGLLQRAVQLHASGAHVVDVGFRILVLGFKGALFLGLAPEAFIVPVRFKGRVDVDDIHARGEQLLEGVEIFPAIDHASIHKG